MASTAIRLLVPRIPLLLKTGLFHTLSWTETSSKWDLKTELIIATIRSILDESKSTISEQQALSLKDPGVQKNQIIAKVSLPAPEEDDIRQLLFRIISELDTDDRPRDNEYYTQPALRAVTGEWTGWRDLSKPLPANTPSEAEKYKTITSMATSPLVILYFHGGAHYLMDPASHRGTTCKLARLTGGRAFSVRYRLAPQNPFPAGLIDAFVAYMSLLYPPGGALHEAVKPEHIIFAGDSAGGNLCLALLLLVLQITRGSRKVRWNGKEVEVLLPGGVATNSAWTDVTRSLPSLQTNARYDYLPPVFRSTDASAPAGNSGLSPKNPTMPPPCSLWPQPPPRADLYCSGPLMCHPLVSPLAADVDLWRGSPPMFFNSGEEMLSDEIHVVVRRCLEAGVKVKYEGFEAMPHCFAMMLEGSTVGARCFEGWAAWMKALIESGPLTGGVWFDAPKLNETPLDLKELTKITDEEVSDLMQKEMVRRIRIWEDSRKDAAVAKL